MARQCVPENTLNHLATEYALGKSGHLTYFPIESPLRKAENMFNSLNKFPLRKIPFQYYQPNL